MNFFATIINLMPVMIDKIQDYWISKRYGFTIEQCRKNPEPRKVIEKDDAILCVPEKEHDSYFEMMNRNNDVFVEKIQAWYNGQYIGEHRVSRYMHKGETERFDNIKVPPITEYTGSVFAQEDEEIGGKDKLADLKPIMHPDVHFLVTYKNPLPKNTYI